MRSLSLAERFDADRRRAMLSVLAQTDAAMNEFLLKRVLADLGQESGKFQEDVALLMLLDLVVVENVEGMMMIALSPRGLDVQRGLVVVEGVARKVRGEAL
jgi:hypothetical protein